jgi:hypothetical protein
LAYSAVVGSAEEPGLWDTTETAPQRAICSIVIMDLQTQRTLKQTDSDWVYINRWLPQDRFLYHTSDGYAVGDSYIYDAHSRSILNIGMANERAWESDFSFDGSMEVYVDGEYVNKHTRYDLHCVDANKSTDRVLLSRDFRIMQQRISHSTKSIAFLQVQDPEVPGASHQRDDVLWLYDLNNSTCLPLYRGPTNSMFAGVQYLEWSFDDQYVGMFFSGEAIVVDIKHPSRTVKTAGDHFSWIGNDKLIYTRSKCIYLYDLATRSSKMILKDADQTTFLQKPRE